MVAVESKPNLLFFMRVYKDELDKIKEGTIFRFMTNIGFDVFNSLAIVTSYSILEDKVFIGSGDIYINDFLSSGIQKKILQENH